MTIPAADETNKEQAKPFPELIPEGYPVDGVLAPIAVEDQSEYGPDPEGFADPIGENRLKSGRYLIRKYMNRALYLATGRCAMHCRFCFRRGGSVHGNGETPPEEASKAARLVAGNPQIREVIISGGDPLTLSDESLGELLALFGGIAGIERLRIHTRAPVVTPSRVTAKLAAALASSPKPLEVVLHAAHPDELAGKAVHATRMLKSATARLACQSVLLAGINDEPKTLADLFDRACGLGMPHRYLHHPDRVRGARAFRLPIGRGLQIYGEAASLAKNPAPPYVLDLPDGSGKTPVSALLKIAEEHEGGKVRTCYRWERPPSWDGVGEARSLDFWDVWEPIT